jgi:hypothetical protein
MRDGNKIKVHETKYNYHHGTRSNNFSFQGNNQSRLPLIINRGCNQFNTKMKKIQELLN